MHRRPWLYLITFLSTMPLYANGGPVDWGVAIGTANPVLTEVEQVLLVEEELNITVGTDQVEVLAVYTLRNAGGAVEVDYAFPVEALMGFAPDDECGSVSVRIMEGAVPLPLDTVTVSDSLPHPEGYQAPGATTWFSTPLAFEAGATRRLTIRCTLPPYFEDFATSKSFLPSWSRRHFRYRLDPAGGWGDGRAGRLSCCIDFTGILEKGGEVEVVQGPNGITERHDGIWTLEAEDFPMAGAEHLEIAWGVRAIKLETLLEEYALQWWELEDVRVSSALPDQGPYSYGAENLFDGDLATAWAEGAAGPGVGEGIEVDLPSYFRLGCIALVNGYRKDDDALRANGRASEVTVAVVYPDGSGLYPDGNTYRTVELDDPPGDADQSGMGQTMEILWQTGSPRPAESVRLEFTGVLPGETYEDLCISELLIIGLREGQGYW